MNGFDTALDQLYVAAWDVHNLSSRPSHVFHYTSAEGLCGILGTKVLFASDLLHLNDPSEFCFGKSLIMKVLSMRSDSLSEALLRNFEGAPLFPHIGERWSLYSISFCGTKDLLGQWRGYGGAAGYAIGVELKTLLELNGRLFAVHQMLYDEAAQVSTIDAFISQAGRLFDQHANPQNEDELLNSIGTKLIMSIFNLKHAAFRGEDEWRILLLESFDNPEFPVRYRVSGGRIIPYIELRFDAGWVTSVDLGPTAATQLNEQAVSRMLVTGGFTRATTSVSTIPMRV